MTDIERAPRIILRGEEIEFAITSQDVIQLTTPRGSELKVDLSNIDSNPQGQREVVLISSEIAGKTKTGNPRSTVTGVRKIELSRGGTGSQILPQPEGGSVEVDLGRAILEKRSAKLKLEKDGVIFDVKANVYFPDPRFDI